MTIDIRPVEIGGKFWIAVVIDNDAMAPKGPFETADTAESVARRLRWFGRALANSGGRGG